MLSTYDKTDTKNPGLKTFSYKVQLADNETVETKEDKYVVAGRNLYAVSIPAHSRVLINCYTLHRHQHNLYLDDVDLV